MYRIERFSATSFPGSLGWVFSWVSWNQNQICRSGLSQNTQSAQLSKQSTKQIQAQENVCEALLRFYF